MYIFHYIVINRKKFKCQDIFSVSRKYFSKNLKPIDIVIMNVSEISTFLARQTHEFSLKFRYNRFTTSIKAWRAHARAHTPTHVEIPV